MSIVGAATLALIFAGRPVGSQPIVLVGVEGQVDTYTTNSQNNPVVGYGGDGNFVVVWHSVGSSGTDTSGRSIQGQRFAIPLFADGFESGDSSAWSSTLQ